MAPDWLLPAIVGAVLGWLIGMGSQFIISRAKDWIRWYRQSTRIGFLEDALRSGERITHAEAQQIIDGPEGRQPPLILLRLRARLTRRERAVDSEETVLERQALRCVEDDHRS